MESMPRQMESMADDFPNDADGEVLRRIAQDGSDLSRPMFINFHVAVLNEASAKELAKLARKLGYRVRVYKSPECTQPWTCECSTRMVATYESVIAVQNELAEISRQFDGVPDGWGTFGNGPSGPAPVR
jgi:regulator of RNase E activity RraB